MQKEKELTAIAKGGPGNHGRPLALRQARRAPA